MSVVPQPCRVSPSSRDGTLSAIGTVSMCPASITRVGRPRSVRASTDIADPLDLQVRSARSAASMASAIGASVPETDGMSTSAAVSAAGSACRSSAVRGGGGGGSG